MDDFVNSLPEKEEHVLTNNGSNLSQGQRQRVMIARVLYKDPEVILFDEATNALDTKTESFILASLKEMATDKTIIVVTHRLHTIRGADKIVVIEKGKIAAQGRHEELLRTSAPYSALVNKQID